VLPPPTELPILLAGVLVVPPVLSSAGGHAWVWVDEQCHLHYQIVVAGLSKGEELAGSAHLHGLAEIGEMDEGSHGSKRLLTGFYGPQVWREGRMHAAIRTKLHTHTHGHTRTHTHAQMHTCQRTQVYTHTHKHTHMHMHTHKHANLQTHTQALSGVFELCLM
jgi:hypothetical protein